jgi:glycosyltransferase involved in cell wall biosynthesis
MPIVDIIIPTHNRAKTLIRAIESVCRQSFKDWKLWIIDDGSTDETKELVTPFLSPNIHYQRIENGGVSQARNFGVSLGDAKWLAFLDSDDEWLPERLEKQFELYELEKRSLIHGEELWVRNGKRVNPKNKHQKHGGDIFERCLPLCLISPSATLMTRELFYEMEGFDCDFIVCEDYDLWLKVTSLHQVSFVRDPIIIKYGGHEDQLSARYRAMDYWRVKSLNRILSIRELSKERIELVQAEIIQKCTILLNGYEKHQNFKDFDEIMNIKDSIKS